LGAAGVVGPQARARLERLAGMQLSAVGQIQVATALIVMDALAKQLHDLRAEPIPRIQSYVTKLAYERIAPTSECPHIGRSVDLNIGSLCRRSSVALDPDRDVGHRLSGRLLVAELNATIAVAGELAGGDPLGSP
jgi:hypothetical protein